MNYVLFNDLGAGEHFISSPEPVLEDAFAGFKAVEADEYSHTDLPLLRLNSDGGIYKVNSDTNLATQSAIRNMYLTLVSAPIELNNQLFDFDTVSENRMLDALTYWDELTQVTDYKIEWVMADNSTAIFTKEEFKNALDNLAILRVKRTAKLHAAYQRIKANAGVTMAYISDINNW
jgi:hypothetical protein